MNKLTYPLLLVAALVLPNLSGCVAVGLASLAPNIGGLADTVSTDSDMSMVHLAAPTTGDVFVERSKTIAARLGYQVAGVNGHGATERGVLLTKQSADLAGAFIGRDWQYTVALNLEENGRAIQVLAKTSGNNHMADPGTAKKVTETFKDELVAYYARR